VGDGEEKGSRRGRDGQAYGRTLNARLTTLRKRSPRSSPTDISKIICCILLG
jgi:hypothetical protein